VPLKALVWTVIVEVTLVRALTEDLLAAADPVALWTADCEIDSKDVAFVVDLAVWPVALRALPALQGARSPRDIAS
jgi:hypothetical protein